jgi:hypothetical protein
VDPAAVTRVQALLDELARAHRVAIGFAVESGSRAWGFPSPDSDYDCRFVFLRSVEDYLSPWPQRDVIESPPDPVLDVNGWDLRKAARLVVEGNATVGEWLRSPIGYRAAPGFAEEFGRLADAVADRAAIGRHYLHVGRQQWERCATGGSGVPLKRLFYALRPAAALRWLRVHPAARVPPMDLPTLMAGNDAAPAVVEQVAELVRRKAETREMGAGEVPPGVRDFVVAELYDAGWTAEPPPPAVRAAAVAEASAFCSAAIRRYGPVS